MKNTLGDLNNHLFAQLERLSDEELVGEELQNEMVRAKGVTEIAKTIVLNGKLMLDAHRLQDQRLDLDRSVPRVLIGKDNDA